ncbi:hypothetical protein GCM10023149_29680 [Mucilaginibacter gynuensis]|uniref:HTH cro/C1-type domain-containing protein n=1 Tax=Mucilaginibacter gynuensis TaxID=1302236 RepID=A0ABP8GLW4_9SPHI
MENTKKIGEMIRIQRTIKGYNQEYMAFELNISQSTYSKMERDESEITLTRIYEIAEILEISPFILMPKPKYGTVISFHGFSKFIKKVKQILIFNRPHAPGN